MALVMFCALAGIFGGGHLTSSLGVASLLLYLWLARRQFGFGTWFPVLMALAGLGAALWEGVSPDVLWHGAERMLFLAALIAMLGTLRSAADIAPEVHRAGLYVTGQPAARRYLAMTFGGHLFGVLINFGGLALLLDLAKRSMSSQAAANLPPEAQEARLRRMTVAVIRGFSLISLWSPFGFATNAVLIAVPGLSYMSFGPLGFAMSFVFIAIGWVFDHLDGRRFKRLGLPRPSPPPRSGLGAAALVGHVIALGLAVFSLHELTPLSFQEGLILAVPCYALLWSAASGRGAAGGAMTGIARASSATWNRLSTLGAEVGVFASAGFLPVVLLALIPAEQLQTTVAGWAFGPVTLTLGLSFAVFASAMIGVNPIVAASVLGATAAQLDVPGLSDTAIALALTGGWTAVIGLSPFITTLVMTSSIVKRSTPTIGLEWNGPYCLTILTVWSLLLVGLLTSGVI
ncbi:hypothetical protein IV417_12875 [Alphaproteobacteria bacterium KMM 3653]|uniref:Uncharacterized protein n=1 Tax=Harenicola maris TaxID=2841044 RepID=A0AAP2CQ62_9RHOB|nr:hypothetical protein [Harenicola maris]